MALIKCSECGHEVSDKASTCPNCGCPIEKGLVCNECGATISSTDKTCPNCGNPLKRKFNLFLYVKLFLGILLIGFAIIGGMKLLQMSSGNSPVSSDNVDDESIRMKMKEDSIETEQRRIQDEAERAKKMLASVVGVYRFDGAYMEVKFTTNYTYGGVYDSKPHSYNDGCEKWDCEIIVQPNGKVSSRAINYRKEDKNGNVIEREDVHWTREVFGEVEIIEDGLFKVKGQTGAMLNRMKGFSEKHGQQVLGNVEYRTNECVFDMKKNRLYKNISDYRKRDGYDDVYYMPFKFNHN